MKKDRIVLDFVKFPIPQKVEFGKNVIVRLKGNAKFPTPDVTIEALEAATTLLETRSIAAQGGGKEATALMHQAEDEWCDIMRVAARYVDRIADGDTTVILGAGFNLAKQPAPAVRPEFSVELGEKSGSVLLRHQAVEGAQSYIWQYCIGDMPAADDNWTIAQVTVKASVELTGLTPLTKYWFRSAAVTTSGTTPYSMSVLKVVI